MEKLLKLLKFFASSVTLFYSIIASVIYKKAFMPTMIF